MYPITKHFLSFFFALLLTTLASQNVCMAQTPVMTWDCETVKNRSAIEESTNIADTIEGNIELPEGVTGKGMHLDGFTTRIISNGNEVNKKAI